MNFVYEQKRALALVGAAFLRILKNPFQIRHAGKNGGNLLKVQIGMFGDQAGDGGFAAARRPPENERGDFARLHHPPERRVRPHHMILPDHFA